MGLAVAAQAPKADVLDVVFNDDGTIVDVSAMANPIRVTGAPDIKKSPMYGMNVLCNDEDEWGSETFNNVRVPYNDKLVEALRNGMTMEVMARPCFENGTISNRWCNIFGCYQGGGFGIIIYNGVWDFECVIDQTYKDATYGPVVDGEWIHLVGVWDKEAGVCKFYANGELVSTVDGAGGELGFPTTDGHDDECFVGLGIDFDPGSSVFCREAFQGDIAIARIYNDPLTGEQVKALYEQAEAKKTSEPEHVDRVFPTLRTDEDGTVLIANFEEMENFARSVRMGKIDLNAKLEADIDFSAAKKIISYHRSYTGTFDGQGHTLKLGINTSTATGAPFMYLSNATVRNLHITGNIVINNAQFAGSVASHTYSNTLIENVSSDVTITSTIEGDGSHGGLVGVANEGTTINDCVFSGSIVSESTTRCAGFVGWASKDVIIKNSLQIGDISSAGIEGAVFARHPEAVRVSNSYYTTMVGDSDNGGTLADDDQLANGEVCWKLNGSSPLKSVWRQTVEQDAAPVLDPSHGFIMIVDGSTYCITDAESMKEAANVYSFHIGMEMDEYEVYMPLKDNLHKHSEELSACTTVDEFVAKCAEIEGDKLLIIENKNAYTQLLEAAQTTLEKLEGLLSEPAIILRAYIEEDIEPNETYVNGSLNYIVNNHSLSTEDIAKEITYMDDMLVKALSSGTLPGTDVTMLVQNPDFLQKGEGWDWTKMADYFEVEKEKGYYGMHYWGSTSGSFSQTIIGLAEGVYELDMNGCSLVGDDADCNYYTSFIFAGNNEMPLMGIAEDFIPIDDPIVNELRALGTVRERGEQAIPYSLGGATYAMCQGNYYLNRVFANVTDGKLTIGGCLKGSGRNDDWPIFAKARLIYQGTLEEASEAMDKGLEQAVARANTTIEFKSDAWGSNYVIYPNYSEQLRNGLRQAVADAATVKTGAEKYALLERFSDLFRQIYTCRKAYTQCARDLIGLDARVDDYPDHTAELTEIMDDAWNGWNSGAYSEEEALQLGTKVAEMMDKFNVEIGEADLLDVVFNIDGTATDKSAAQNTIELFGTPSVVASPTLNMNVFCGAEHEWSAHPKNNYVVNVSDAMKTGIEDGVTMELLVRPYFEGTVPGSWCTVFGSENDGGMGMLVYGSQWCFEAYTGGSYRDAYSGIAPVSGEWTHLVGVWDGSEVKVYVNGSFSGSATATGAYGWPVNVDRQWFGIGCDLAINDTPASAFPGDIAIVRMYDTPLNGSQISKLYKGVKAIISDIPEHNEGETAITGVSAVKPANGIIYDITGRRVSRMDTKGLYIVNGKKIVVK